MLNKDIPFLRIGLPLWAGIVTGLYYNPGDYFFIIAGVLTLIALIVSYLNKIRFNSYLYGIALSSILYLAGLYLYSVEKKSITILKPMETVFEGYIDDYPQEKEKTLNMVLRINKIYNSNSQKNTKGGIHLIHTKDSLQTKFLPGDKLVIKCKPLEIINRGNPCEFNYKLYMQNQGIGYYAFSKEQDIIEHSRPESVKIRHLALIMRERLIDMFRQRGIKGDELALISAMTLGQKNLLDNGQKEIFIKAGVMHIMAVSGLHAVILSLFVFRVLFFMKGKLNSIRIIVALIILWIFTFITGLTPSVLRATIMFTFFQAGKFMHRPVNGINSVLASAFLLTIIKPSVIFEAGFLLSYSAVIYIIAFYSDFYHLWQPKFRMTEWIWQSAAVTVIAQAGTLPLTITMFNRFPSLFLFTNIVIVPLSSLVIIIGFVVIITYPLKILSTILALLLSKLTWLTEFLTEKASSVPFSTIEQIGMTPMECFLLALTLLFSFIFLFRKRKLSIVVPMFFTLLFVIVNTKNEIELRKSKELIFYNSQDKFLIGIRNGKNLEVISDTNRIWQEIIRHKSILRLKTNSRITDYDHFSVIAGDKSIGVYNTMSDYVSRAEPANIIYISKGSAITGLTSGKKPKQSEALIFGNKIYSNDFRIKRFTSFTIADTIHFIRDKGAFYMKL